MVEGSNRESFAMPNLIDVAIVGTQKAGTTSLAHALAEHPQICLALGKETHLFDRVDVQNDGVDDAELLRHFAHRRPGQLLLDATPSYMYLPGCLDALVRHSPDVRVIVVLRDPVERALSHHAHSRSVKSETLPALPALLLERSRLGRDADPLGDTSAHRRWSYVDRGRYAPQLERLRSLTENVHVATFEQMIGDTAPTLRRILRFIGVDDTVTLSLPHLNISKRRGQHLARLAARVLTRGIAAETERALSLPPRSLPW